jgi:electron transfer flavoprotein beta subunit
LGVAEILGVPCITLGRKVEVKGDTVVVERLIPDGYEVVEASLPALVTVSNELGQPRYPTLRGIMAATRKRPTIWSAADLEIESGLLEPRITLHDLFVPQRSQECEIIEADNEADAARQLAFRLREAKLI